MFCHATLLTKMDRRHRMRNAKRTFDNLRKTRTITEIRFRPIKTQLSEPVWADKNQWVQNVYWLLLTSICHFGSLRKFISIEFSLVTLIRLPWVCFEMYEFDTLNKLIESLPFISI